MQNWYPGDKEGKGGIFNFVTKRGMCKGENSKISWTQIETGSAITWKYPSCILRGDNSTGEFYSVAVTNNYQQADTGTKMTHIGKNTKSTVVSKGISAGHGQNSYRGLVKVLKMQLMPGIIHSVIPYYLVIDVVPILFLIWRLITRLQLLNTKQLLPKLVKIRFFIATREAFQLKMQ